MANSSVSRLALENEVRAKIFALIRPVLEEEFGDVMFVKNTEITMPTVFSTGEECFANVSISLPRGSRDGDPYDGYVAAEDYKAELEVKAERKRKADEKKERAIRDKEAKKAARELKKLHKEAKEIFSGDNKNSEKNSSDSSDSADLSNSSITDDQSFSSVAETEVNADSEVME